MQILGLTPDLLNLKLGLGPKSPLTSPLGDSEAPWDWETTAQKKSTETIWPIWQTLKRFIVGIGVLFEKFGFCSSPAPFILPHVETILVIPNLVWEFLKMSPSRWVLGIQVFLLCTRADKRSSIFRYFCGWDMIDNTCPKFFWLFPAGLVKQNSVGTACLDLKVFPEDQLWPFLQVPLQTTATHRDGPLPPGMHTAWGPAPQPHIKHQLCCPCRMPSEKPWVPPLVWYTERMSTNANCPYLHYLKHVDPFSFKLTKYLLGKPFSVVSSKILYHCTPTLLQSPGETPHIHEKCLSRWLLKYGGGGSRWPRREYHLETF